MKKYKVSPKKCLQCGGFISWDEFPNPRHPIHVDEQGNKIGDGGCPLFKKHYQNEDKNAVKRPLSSEKANKIAVIVIISLIVMPIATGMIPIIYYYNDILKNDKEIDDTNNPIDDKNQGDKGTDEDTDNEIIPVWEIDAVGTATYIVDGDTYDVDSVGRIRFADVDTPDKGEDGYEAAKNYLSSLIFNKKVYLDIDDKYRTDKYNRTVAVTYVRYNETYLLNVNKDLLIKGYAVIWDFDNEFDPSLWSQYVYYE